LGPERRGRESGEGEFKCQGNTCITLKEKGIIGRESVMRKKERGNRNRGGFINEDLGE